MNKQTVDLVAVTIADMRRAVLRTRILHTVVMASTAVYMTRLVE